MAHVSMLLCVSLRLLCSGYGEDSRVDMAPALVKVEQTLRTVLADVDPQPVFEYQSDGQSLVVKYRVRKFMVHSTTKMGKHSEKAHEVDGPSYKGFLLKVDLQEAGDVNQARVPQTLRRPYWMTAIDVTPIPASDKQIFWGLSYGSRADKDLLKKVKEALKAGV